MPIRFLQACAGGGRSLSARWIPLLTGCVLLSAACLKAHRLLTNPSLSGGIFERPWFQVLLVEAEAACGLALWLGVWPRLVRWAAMLLFAGFLGAAMSLALTGVKSCTCFGDLHVFPWLAALMDLGFLALLGVATPQAKRLTTERATFSERCAVLVALALLVVFPFALFAAVARSDVYPHLEVVRLEVPRARMGLDSIEQSGRVVLTFELRNPHKERVIVAHVQSSCPCLEVQGLPWLLQGGEEKTVDVSVDVARRPNFVGTLQVELRGQTPEEQLAFVAVAELVVAPSPRYASVSR